MFGMFTLRVGVAGVLSVGGDAFAQRNAVPDGDLLGSDEDVLDEQPQDALLLGDGGHGGVFAELGEEVLQAGGELEVGLAVDELVGQGGELAAQAGLAGAQLGGALAQLVEGDQLFLVGLDQPVDRGGGLGQCLLEAALRGGGGVRS
jgi:hypothetical protein